MIIDLNCDMGEFADARHEAALMQHITSANIACGGHAGDEATMERTARQDMRPPGPSSSARASLVRF